MAAWRIAAGGCSLALVGGGVSWIVNKNKSNSGIGINLGEGDRSVQVLNAATKLISNARFAAFITIDSHGFPHARIIDPLPPSSNFDEIWIGTNRFTRKVGHIAQNPRSAILYFDTSSLGFAYISGTSSIVDESKSKSEKFASGWWLFYPEGPEGQRFVLIQFAPKRIEVVSPLHQIASGLNCWRPASVVIDSKAASGWSLEPEMPEAFVAKLRNGLDEDGK